MLRLVINRKPSPGKGNGTYGEEQIFINHENVPASQLRAKLRTILSTRSDRTVYVVGPGEAEFSSIASLVDTARGAYASKVVLVTSDDYPVRAGTAQNSNVR